MLTTANSYSRQRAFGDFYISAMNGMAADLLMSSGLIQPTFITPTVYADTKLGIDMYVDFDRVKLAYRTRQFQALDYALNGFTIRRTGNTSELQKIMAGVHADYMLYGIASQNEDGTLHGGILIDLKSVGEQLNRIPAILEKATWKPTFIDLPYDLFPDDVCVGQTGINKDLERVH